MKKYLILIVVVGWIIFTSLAQADDLTGRTGVGIGYLYVSVKHGLNPKTSLEGLITEVLGKTTFGGRIYRNITPEEKMVWYIGGGVYLLSKRHETGFGFSGFGGGEYFLDKDFTIGGDLGPLFSTLTDSMDFDLKFGIHCYF